MVQPFKIKNTYVLTDWLQALDNIFFLLDVIYLWCFLLTSNKNHDKALKICSKFLRIKYITCQASNNENILIHS